MRMVIDALAECEVRQPPPSVKDARHESLSASFHGLKDREVDVSLHEGISIEVVVYRPTLG